MKLIYGRVYLITFFVDHQYGVVHRRFRILGRAWLDVSARTYLCLLCFALLAPCPRTSVEPQHEWLNLASVTGKMQTVPWRQENLQIVPWSRENFAGVALKPKNQVTPNPTFFNLRCTAPFWWSTTKLIKCTLQYIKFARNRFVLNHLSRIPFHSTPSYNIDHLLETILH